MKLYFSKGACSLAVRIIIHELKLPCEFISVNLKTKQTVQGENFLTINPKGAVPTLVTEQNEILTENSVIQQYLAETHHATQLLPANGMERYRVLEWLNFISTDLHKNFGPLFNPKVPEEVKEEIFKPLIKQKLNYVNRELGQKKFLRGDQFTLPDGYLFVMLSWADVFKIDMAELSNLTRYFAELKKRPTIRQALQEESSA